MASVFLGTAVKVDAFSMLGAPAAWQTSRIGYNLSWFGNDDLGGPMTLGDEYRITVKTITYGFTPEFVNWFGQKGIDEVEKAIKVFNDLGDLSVVDPNAFPLRTTRFNATAFQLDLVDLKSDAMRQIIEFAGLANAERFVYCLRDLVTVNNQTTYTVVQRNFDPITYKPTSSINGHLFTYLSIFDDTTIAYPVVTAVDPLAELQTSVASWPNARLSGNYYNTLSRDDVGGLKYIYRTDNYNVETLPVGTSASAGGVGVSQLNGSSSIWTPVLPNLTNTVATIATNLVDRGLRPGIGKLNFHRVEYDNVFGDFLPVSVKDQDVVITNGFLTRQSVERLLTAGPDLVFTAEDVNAVGVRGGIGFTNFDPISTVAGDAGPGAINVPYQISLSKVGPRWINNTPFFLREDNALIGSTFGSYDGTSNEPVVYPDTASIQELEAAIASGGGQGIAWVPVPGLAVTNPNDPNAAIN